MSRAPSMQPPPSTIVFETDRWKLFKRSDSARYQVYFTFMGASAPYRLSTGTKNLEEAKAAAEIIYKRERACLMGESQDCAIAKALTDYTRRSVNLGQAKKTQQTWKCYRDEMIKLWGDQKTIASLIPSDIDHYIGHLGKLGLGPSAVNRRIAMLRAAINYAKVNKWHRGENPLDGFKRMTEQPREKWFTPAEIADVLRVAHDISREGRQRCLEIRQKAPNYSNKTHQAFYLYIRVLASTGGRAGEVLALRWDDIGSSHIVFRASTTKGKKTRIAAVPPEIIKEILAYKDESEFVIDVDYREASQFARHWTKLRKRIGLSSEYHVHTLRHSYATNLLAAGYDIKAVQLIMGHSSVAVTDIYSHRSSVVDMTVLRSIAPAITG